MSERRRKFLTERAGLKLEPADEPPLLLCTYCGRTNALIGITVLPIMTVVGLILYPLCLRARKHYSGY